jgi:hypothetical protein
MLAMLSMLVCVGLVAVGLLIAVCRRKPDLPARQPRRPGAAEWECMREPITADGFGAGCMIPPPGWYCTRAAGHDGPCAALPIGPNPDRCRGWVSNPAPNHDEPCAWPCARESGHSGACRTDALDTAEAAALADQLARAGGLLPRCGTEPYRPCPPQPAPGARP